MKNPALPVQRAVRGFFVASCHSGSLRLAVWQLATEFRPVECGNLPHSGL